MTPPRAAAAARALLAAALCLLPGVAHPQSVAPAEPPLREVQLAVGAFTRGEPLPDWTAPAAIPPTENRKPVVIRLADTQFLAGERPQIFVNRAVQVNETAALSYIGQYPLFFTPQYQRLRLHAVRVLRGAESLDHTSRVNVRFLDREAGLEQGVYSGVITALLLVEDVRVGDTLHVQYTIEGSNPVFGGRYSEFASWDQAEPVEQRRVTLIHPRDRPIRWRMNGDFRNAGITPVSSEANGLVRLLFEERALAGVAFEPYVPPEYSPARFLQFTEFATWNAVARWADGLFPTPAALPAEMEALLQRLRALPDEDARISAALQWVQTEIRYFSVSLGDSSHRPYPPDTVLQRRYGDCKDKSFLLVALLRRLGVTADPALVSTRTRSGPASLLPTPHAFDHVVVRVESGGQTHFIDPTRLGQRGRLQNLGQALEGAAVLVARPGTAALETIVSPDAATGARTELEEKLTLSGLNGDGELEIRHKLRGVSAESLRLSFAQSDSERRKQAFTSPYERRYAGITLLGEPRIEDDEERNVLTLVARYRIPKPVIEDRNGWLVRFQPGNFAGTFAIPDALKRNFPLVVPSHPLEARYSLQIIWPASVSMIQDPSTQRLDAKYFGLEANRSFRGNRSTLALVLRTKAAVIEAPDVPKVAEDIRALDRVVRGFIAIGKEDVKSPGFLGIGASTVQDTLRARLTEVVERTTKTIAAGRLRGTDLAQALCDRAGALADLERPDEGMKDAQEAVKVAPALPTAHRCRGNLHFAVGEFARAVADYTRALSLGDDAFFAFYRRGHARFFQGQLAEAAEDFEKASTAADSADRVYADLWHAWTLSRLRKPLPAELMTRARDGANAAWPRPALAMLAAIVTPEQMMADVQRSLSGDEREMALAEAWFYLGQHRLALGETAAAREAFEKARNQRITAYIEHVAAGFELRRLSAGR